MEQSSFDGRKQFGGFAQLDDDRSGNAFYTQDPQPSVELPSNTVFPMQHVRNILEQAENGEKLIAATLFTGAEPENALMRTSTVVGGWRTKLLRTLANWLRMDTGRSTSPTSILRQRRPNLNMKFSLRCSETGWFVIT